MKLDCLPSLCYQSHGLWNVGGITQRYWTKWDLFTQTPCLWAHPEPQHQESAAGWPLNIGYLVWGHWFVSMEGGLDFLIYSDTHGQYIHTMLYRAPQKRSSSSTLYIVFPLCPSDFQSLLLTWRNDFQPFLKVSSLSLICSLSSICQVSYHHEWTGSQHTKKKTMLVCLTKIWKLAPNLSVHSTPFLLLMIPFSFPQQSVTLLISLTVVIVTKILYLEKK